MTKKSLMISVCFIFMLLIGLQIAGYAVCLRPGGEIVDHIPDTVGIDGLVIGRFRQAAARGTQNQQGRKQDTEHLLHMGSPP